MNITGTRSVIDIIEIYTASQVQNLDETDCVSYSTNIFGKSMKTIPLSAMGKIVGQIGVFTLGTATRLGEEKLRI